ncbi:hypothetical protein Sp245p_29925 (plasmid) [Azospirillum baldaniorum]|uniref:Uncharacterized protein n=1 Tax=Azospirillum baldaniorum TaxID=1064539 RepID=A0A9P1JYP4_9PROT|nr:hypothetical protein Sp245p_29925 [Azospirillum baldaniorum]CCD02235.1 protein of unknown function [Azospirillum baldaniorum]
MPSVTALGRKRPPAKTFHPKLVGPAGPLQPGEGFYADRKPDRRRRGWGATNAWSITVRCVSRLDKQWAYEFPMN